jgi:molybdate transport system ATP-binding protein
MANFALDFALHQGGFIVEIAAAAAARAIALIGPSGSGKTSVLEAIAGLRTPRRGRIALNDRVLFDSAARTNVPPRLRHVGYVPQDTLLFPHLTVRGNVEYGKPRGRTADMAMVVRLLELTTLMDRRVSSLSGGERQRVALARALHSAPDVLLLDEPLAAVDVARRARIIDALLEIRDTLQVPLVYVTHAADEALAVADYAIALDEGRVVAAGPTQQVLGR